MKTKTIKLTDKEARIVSIEINDPESGQTTVTFEWGGPDDRDIAEFDVLSLCGETDFTWVDCDENSVAKRSAWVIYQQGINEGWRVGDTVPLINREFIIEDIGIPHGVKPDRGGGEVEVKTHYLVNGVEDEHETHRITLSHAVVDDDGEIDLDQVSREVWAAFDPENNN
tara:strand:- start:156 stop:662 length:507 start_codon:yes stop_codon:yes gene_type:complete